MALALNQKFADWVEEVLSSRGIKSLRQAEPRTGLSHSTIKNMKDGRVPEETIVIRFASVFDENIPDALRLAGYEDMAKIWEEGRSPEQSDEAGPNQGDDDGTAPRLTYEPLEHDEEELVSFYRGIPPVMQPAAKAALKAILDAMPNGEDFTTFGKKAE